MPIVPFTKKTLVVEFCRTLLGEISSNFIQFQVSLILAAHDAILIKWYVRIIVEKYVVLF